MYQSVPETIKENEISSKSAQKRQRNEEEKRSSSQVNEGIKLEDIQIVEDVDESQFIPAYLSSTENDLLNDTELNTEYNTSRPLNGLQTDRVSKGSLKRDSKSGHNSARGKIPKEKTGGLTDRERGTQWLGSEV